MSYVVRFLDLDAMTRDEWEYKHLLEALQVISSLPGMTKDKLDAEFLLLLTSGFIYSGAISEDYPDGKYMSYLFKKDDDGMGGDVQSPVFGMSTLYNSIPRVPSARTASPTFELITNELKDADNG